MNQYASRLVSPTSHSPSPLSGINYELPSINTHRSISAASTYGYPYPSSASPIHHQTDGYIETHRASATSYRSPNNSGNGLGLLNDNAPIDRSLIKHLELIYVENFSIKHPIVPWTIWDLDTGFQCAGEEDRTNHIIVDTPFNTTLTYWVYAEQFYLNVNNIDEWKYVDNRGQHIAFNCIKTKDGVLIPQQWDDYIPDILNRIVKSKGDGEKKKGKKDVSVLIDNETHSSPFEPIDYIPWRCALPGRCRYAGTFSNLKLNFNLLPFTMTIDEFLDELKAGKGEIVLTLSNHVLVNALKHTQESAAKTGCVIPELIYIDQIHSTLPDIFDIQLCTSPYLEQTGKEGEEIQWFSCAGTSNSIHPINTPIAKSTFAHIVYPGSVNIPTLVYQADIITRSPLFNRWAFVNQRILEDDRSRLYTEGTMCQIQCPSVTEIHPKGLIQYIAMTEAPRMLQMAYERKADFPDSKPSKMVYFDDERNYIYVDARLLDHVIAEKFVGPMNRNRHVMRLNKKVCLKLKLHENASMDWTKKIERLRSMYGKVPFTPASPTIPSPPPARESKLVSFGAVLNIFYSPWEGV
jgi:hypothetical protein